MTLLTDMRTGRSCPQRTTAPSGAATVPCALFCGRAPVPAAAAARYRQWAGALGAMDFVPPPDGDDFHKDATCPWLCAPTPAVADLLSDPAGVAALRRAVRPGRRVALHGAPGRGKYTAAVAVARAAGMAVTTVWAHFPYS